MSAVLPFGADTLGRVPLGTGVYIFRAADGEVLYIGKGKSLRRRVSTYLAGQAAPNLKVAELASRAATVETLVVGSEEEALILEASLIREHKPRFNIQLRDDKSYPHIRVTVQEPYPRAYITRRIRRDGARYFGPFPSVGRARRALELLKRSHGIRSCRYDLPREQPSRPCLDYHIGRCGAPCTELQSETSYRNMTHRFLKVLSGDVAQSQREVEDAMHKASSELDFERAAALRDAMKGLDSFARRQRIHVAGGGDQDVFGVARAGESAAAVVLQVRRGVVVGSRSHALTGVETYDDDGVLLGRSVAHEYFARGTERSADLPREVLLPSDFADRHLLERTLSRRAGWKVATRIPQLGPKAQLVELAQENARSALGNERGQGLEGLKPRADDVLYELQDRLSLKVVPRLIVGFDVSHTQGAEVVAAAVLFRNGRPDRAGYRHLGIKGGFGNDDYRSMAEAVSRYFRRAAESGGPLPDLALVDGGRAQLGAARRALSSAGVEDVALAALAKRHERVFLADRRERLTIPRTRPALHLLQRVRDEAHRFALLYNRKLRSRRTLRSELGDIPGIGPKRQQALLSRFGSVRRVREATVGEIGRVPGFSDAMGARVLAYLADRR